MTRSHHEGTPADQLAKTIREAFDAYLDEVDIEEAGTDDMAWVVVTAIERARR